MLAETNMYVHGASVERSSWFSQKEICHVSCMQYFDARKRKEIEEKKTGGVGGAEVELRSKNQKVGVAMPIYLPNAAVCFFEKERG